MNNYKKSIVLGVGLLFLFGTFPGLIQASESDRGVILGYVFDYDGTSPISGAVVKIKNTANGSVYESSVSDTSGVFNILGIETGIYQYSVSMPDGEFIADDVFGVRLSDNDTAKIAISVAPYSKKLDAAIINASPAPDIEGETFIGRVVDYDASTGAADIFVMQGSLQSSDKIHALGETTDFYQGVNDLALESASVKKVSPGETASMTLHNEAQVGDAVYVAQKRGVGILPFVLGGAAGVAGAARIVSGNNVVTYDQVATVNEEVTQASAFKNKK